MFSPQRDEAKTSSTIVVENRNFILRAMVIVSFADWVRQPTPQPLRTKSKSNQSHHKDMSGLFMTI